MMLELYVPQMLAVKLPSQDGFHVAVIMGESLLLISEMEQVQSK
jgi:hypothetical protein